MKISNRMKWLKFFDIYGAPFEFSIFQEAKYKTFTGGILSLIIYK